MPVSGNYGTPTNPNGDVYSSYWELQWYTGSDPAHVEGDFWGRSDLDSGDKIATLRFDNGSTVVDIPVFPTTTDPNSNVENVARVPTPNGRGWMPIASQYATYNYLAYYHNSTRYGVNDSLSAIPDSEDLHARWDATELSLSDGQTVSTFSDQTGNGHDLTAGTAPTYHASAINGNPAVGFEGVDEYLDVSFGPLSQPNQIFIVAQVRSISGGDTWYDGYSGGTQQFFDGAGNWAIFAGSGVNDGAHDTDNHIHSHLFDGASSTMRLDGTQTASGDVGTAAMDGFTLGARGNQEAYSDILVGEVLVYPQDKSGIQADVESYLSEKWGIAI